METRYQCFVNLWSKFIFTGYLDFILVEISEKQRRIAAKSMKISFLFLTFFALTGHLLFLVFNITDYAFKIAGGILLVAVALRMLNPGKNRALGLHNF